MVVIFRALIQRRAALWALYPDAPRGRLGGEQNPAEDPGVGLLTVNGAPGAREVEVRHRLTRTIVAVVFSATDGTYRVDDLPSLEEYDVIARDHAGVWEDYILAAVTPYVG